MEKYIYFLGALIALTLIGGFSGFVLSLFRKQEPTDGALFEDLKDMESSGEEVLGKDDSLQEDEVRIEQEEDALDELIDDLPEKFQEKEEAIENASDFSDFSFKNTKEKV